VEYVIEWGGDDNPVDAINSMQRGVNERLAEGWRLYGNLVITCEPISQSSDPDEPGNGWWVAAQALVRDVPDPRQGPPEPR
jgi:hypothetical protein